MPLEKEIVSKRQLRRKIERKLKAVLAGGNISKNDYISFVSMQLSSKDNEKLVFQTVAKIDSMCKSDFIDTKLLSDNKSN